MQRRASYSESEPATLLRLPFREARKCKLSGLFFYALQDVAKAIIVGAVYDFRIKLERTIANSPFGRYELQKNGIAIFPMNSKFAQHHYMNTSNEIILQWEEYE